MTEAVDGDSLQPATARWVLKLASSPRSSSPRWSMLELRSWSPTAMSLERSSVLPPGVMHVRTSRAPGDRQQPARRARYGMRQRGHARFGDCAATPGSVQPGQEAPAGHRSDRPSIRCSTAAMSPSSSRELRQNFELASSSSSRQRSGASISAPPQHRAVRTSGPPPTVCQSRAGSTVRPPVRLAARTRAGLTGQPRARR